VRLSYGFVVYIMCYLSELLSGGCSCKNVCGCFILIPFVRQTILCIVI